MAEWWNEWQLRILVLASLSAQYLILLFLSVRGRYIHIPPRIRVSFRLAQIGGDALAIFALATLFNRQRNGPGCHYMRGSRDLELLWAPILVMHLGGQVFITSYKIEDNEQWRRHILTSLSKVTVTLYVFYKSWSSDDKKMLVATVLLFILMVVKCFQKPLALKASSFNVLREASSFRTLPFKGATPMEEESLNIDDFIKQAKAVYGDAVSQSITWEDELDTVVQSQLFFDVPYTYSQRVEIIRRFRQFDKESAHRAIGKELSAMTSILYTKDNVFIQGTATMAFSLGSLYLVYPALITAICLVHTSSHKDAYSGKDIRVTLVLLYGTFLLELAFGLPTCVVAFKGSYCGILQHNLIGALARKKWGSMFTRMAGWSTEPSHRGNEITQLILGHVESAWTKDYIRSPVSYKKFNDTTGDRTLVINGCLKEELVSSIRRPFGESIFIWHLATDLCFHHKTIARADNDKCAHRCKAMSNYMMHLLFENPEILMPGTRKISFKTAYERLEDNLKGEKTPLDEREIAHKIIEKCKANTHAVFFTPSFIDDAWKLAQILLGYCDHGDETKMWKVIQGVWLETLCFSAARCRGYLHAEALGTGVEYLSYVWFLLAYAGMETFPEKLQRDEGLPFDSDDPPVQQRREDDQRRSQQGASWGHGSSHAEEKTQITPIRY